MTRQDEEFTSGACHGATEAPVSFRGASFRVLGLFGPLLGPFFRHRFCRFLLRLFPLVLAFAHGGALLMVRVAALCFEFRGMVANLSKKVQVLSLKTRCEVLRPCFEVIASVVGTDSSADWRVTGFLPLNRHGVARELMICTQNREFFKNRLRD